ncbi:tetratricopeptide repeat protein [bacterium]|nr:tetratricopeptide repeat protein [bacterium]
MKGIEKATSFLPAQILAWMEEDRQTLQFPAVVAFADASGFTAMSEKLATIGKEGAETLTSILNSYFTAMISRIEENGGFVGKFGGDAMTIFYPAKDESGLTEVANRAVAISLELQGLMEQFHNLKTKAGNFTLGMKIGIAAGNVLFQVVGPSDSGREYLLAGFPLDRAAEAEHHGVSGEVILTPFVAELTGDCNGEVLEDGFVKLFTDTKPPKYKKYKGKICRSDAWQELAKPFIDPPIYNRMELGLDSVGEIRRVSVIFMSFSGLDYDEDPDVMGKLDKIYNWVYELTQRFSGSINKVDMGDKGSKMILTFGAPTAHENGEQHAVHCGLELSKGRDEFSKWGIVWKLGLSTGVVFAGEVGAPTRQEYTVMGSSVNLSARLMAKSEPGHLLIDEATYNRTSDFFEYSEPIKHQFKGISEPLPTYEVLSVKTAELGKTTGKEKSLIGCDERIDEVKSVLKDVTKKEIRVIVIEGDAGLGKSRLSREMIKLTQSMGFTVGGGEALSYADRSPYLIWIAVLKGLMGLSSNATNEENLSQLEDIIKEADPENTYRTPIIANLLGIECPDNSVTKHFDAQLRQENILDFVVQYLRYLSNQKPLAIFFEDSQWIDRNSLEMTAYALRNLPDQPILMVVIRRPYSEKFESPHIAQIENSENVTKIQVCEFDIDNTEKFALGCLEVDKIERELLEFIFEASHGNPSFTEELINNLIAANMIRITKREEEGVLIAESAGDLSKMEVPDSLNSLIMSQLDRLGTEAKLTVKVAAVIGRRFSDEVVKGAYPVELDPVTISQSISELSSQDLVRSTEDADLINYIFKNLLTRDVAYDSLLFAHRREYHHKVGTCLENIYKDSINEQCEEFARHFYISEDDVRAVKYTRMAGEKSFAIYANQSALAYFSRAIERATIDVDADQRYYLLKRRAKVYYTLGDYNNRKKDLDEALKITELTDDHKGRVNTLDDLANYYQLKNDPTEMKRVIDEALAILENYDNPYGKINVMSKMGAFFYLKNEYKEALEWYEKSLTNAEVINDVQGMVSGQTQCGLTNKALGNIEKALEYYDRSVELSRSEGNLKSEAVNVGNIGVVHHQRGDFDKAMEAYNKAFEIAKGIGWKEVQARNLGNLAVLYQYKGERKRALDSYQEKLGLERMMGFQRGEIITLGNIGMWYAEDGDYDTAISYYQQALEMAEAVGLKAAVPQQMLNIGLSLHRRGELVEAREMLEKAVQSAVDIGYKVAEDYARRYLGFVLIDMEELELAEAEFTKAREVAESIGSKIGIASSKVGVGWIGMLRGGEADLLIEAINEARSIQDAETYIVGKIALAKVYINAGEDKEKPLEQLKAALEIAKKAGRRRDIREIEPMIAKLEEN